MSTENDQAVTTGGAIHEIDRRYARALFSLVPDPEKMRAAESALDALLDAMNIHEPLRRVFVSPLHSPEAKASVLDALNDKLGAPDEVRSFTRLLAIKGRADRLHTIAKAFKLLVAGHRGASRIEVCTAREVSQERRAALIAYITELCGGEVDVHMNVDSALIGGVRMRMGSRVVDASISGRIDRLTQLLQGN